jgi:hypothetical protein
MVVYNVQHVIFSDVKFIPFHGKKKELLSYYYPALSRTYHLQNPQQKLYNNRAADFAAGIDGFWGPNQAPFFNLVSKPMCI